MDNLVVQNGIQIQREQYILMKRLRHKKKQLLVTQEAVVLRVTNSDGVIVLDQICAHLDKQFIHTQILIVQHMIIVRIIVAVLQVVAQILLVIAVNVALILIVTG